MRPPGLSSEVPFAIVGDKKRTNSLIRIISAEVALAPVEAAELSIRPPRFEDRSTRRHGRVSQFLRQPQIFQLADVAELSSMFGIMLIQLDRAAKPRAAGQKQQRKEQKPDRELRQTCSHLSITPQ
jgi:hypothetical protein